MTAAVGSDRAVARLRRAVVRRPGDSFAVSDADAWHYSSPPDLERARREHAGLVALLEAEGVVVERHEAPLPGLADAIFVCDPVLVTPRGTVVLRMGKELRRGEEEALAARLEELGVPIFGRLEGAARAEGGDLLWLDDRTLLVGVGFRTNREGHRQLADLLGDAGVEVLAFDLPYDRGPAACLHLRSLISLLDHDLAVVYPALLPVELWKLLERRVELVEVPEEELATQGPNVLPVAPRRVVVLDGSPRTRRRLEAAGCRVLAYQGEEISHKAEGGPTCLVLPLERGGGERRS